jgi:hypothetical protein
MHVSIAGHDPGGHAMERRLHRSIDESLQQDQYTPEEAADLLEIGIDVVRHAAFTGALRAQVVAHDIITISRHDLLTWFGRSEIAEANQPEI